MREFKFRAWNPANGEMVNFDNEKLCNDRYQQAHLCRLMRGDYGNVLMQYTGLKDKNGVEIYEGDILRILYTDWPSNPAPNNEGLEEYIISLSSIGFVEFYSDSYQINFGEYPSGVDHGPILEGTHGVKEVIGNIHENNELLHVHKEENLK